MQIQLLVIGLTEQLAHWKAQNQQSKTRKRKRKPEPQKELQKKAKPEVSTTDQSTKTELVMANLKKQNKQQQLLGKGSMITSFFYLPTIFLPSELIDISQ